MTSFQVQLIGYYTILYRETRRIIRIWPQTLLPSVITTTLYFLIFGNFIGSRIGEFDGVPYITFIVPGLIMMAVITNSYGNVASSFFGAKFQNNIEELLVSPLNSMTILLGFLSGGLMRGLLVGASVTAVSRLFCPIEVVSLSLIVITMILTALLFSLAGFLNAVYAKSFDDISIVPTFVLTPLTYLGGVFYSITVLPVFWQKASLFNPILYLVNIFRYGFLGRCDISVTYSLIGLVALVIVLFVWCYRLLSKGVGIRT